MTNAIKFAAATLCITMGMTYSQAQSNTVTIAPQVLNISLTGFAGSGGNANSVRLGNKDVLNAMGFSGSNLKLQTGTATVSLTTTNGTTNFTKEFFVVTSGNSRSNNIVDVTPFFSVGTNSAVLTKGKTSYEIMVLGFGEDTTGVVLTNADGTAISPVTFLLQGYTTVQGSGAFSSMVNGSGSTSGTNATAGAVLKGTVNAGAPNKKTITFTPAS